MNSNLFSNDKKKPKKNSQDYLKEIKEQIDLFLDWILSHEDNRKSRSSKIIHDSVWGSNRFSSAEVAVINSPLIQRLRQIHQTAFSFLTYPSAQHTRFEHSLGVAINIEKIYNSLKEKFDKNLGSNDKAGYLSDVTLKTLRFSALLHDIGHGPFSHTSEEIYSAYPEITELKKIDPYKKAKPHEVFAHLIIESKKFQSYLNNIRDQFNLGDLQKELLKNSIIGYIENPIDQYKIDFLNGPFDADKIDYLFRDAHFSGLPIQVDLDRLWFSIDINKINDRKRLTIDWGGVNTLEQIIFSKMMLYPTIYHHHKVRASDCMFKGIIEYCKKNQIKFTRILNNEKIEFDFNRATDFLFFTDLDFYDINIIQRDKNLHKLVHNLLYRRLLKRAVVISVDTVKDNTTIDNFRKMTESLVPFKGFDNPLRYLANKIWEKADKPCMLEEVWLDCPDDPSFGSVNDTFVSPLIDGEPSIPLKEFFQTEQYATQYKHKKWRAHVFCPPEFVELFAKSAKEIFQEELEIEFNNLAFQLCHLNPPR